MGEKSRRGFLSAAGATVIGTTFAGCTSNSGSSSDSVVFRDGFENGTSKWQVKNSAWKVQGKPAYQGTHSAVVSTLSLTKTLAETSFDKPHQLSKFSHAWWERGASYGGGVRLLNDRGEVEIGVATDNPQWIVDGANGPKKVSSGVDYRTWIPTEISFNWQDGTATIHFQSSKSGTDSKTSHQLKHGRNVKKIQIRAFTSANGWQSSSCNMAWDEFVAKA